MKSKFALSILVLILVISLSFVVIACENVSINKADKTVEAPASDSSAQNEALEKEDAIGLEENGENDSNDNAMSQNGDDGEHASSNDDQNENAQIEKKQPSVGLAYELKEDDTYEVVGIGSWEGTDLVIPDTHEGKAVTGIRDYAFFRCSNLTDITIPEGIKSIGEGAFYNCFNLTSIRVPSSVTSIGMGAFFTGIGLDEISVEKGNVVYHSQGNCLIETESKNLILGSHTSVIPADGSVVSIAMGAFAGCINLISITIPASVTSIDELAFIYCYRLVEVYNQSSLNITLGNEDHGGVGLYAKAIYTSEYSTKLSTDENGFILYRDGDLVSLIGYTGRDKELTLPAGITEINSSAFVECVDLSSVTIPASVTTIGDYAFNDCVNLKSVSIPSSLSGIGTGAFGNCDALNYNQYDSALYLGNGDNPYVVLIEAENTSITHCAIHENTRIIYGGAFCDCGSLSSITIPESVTSIEYRAFASCFGLTSVTIPASVTSIGRNAFISCINLTTVNFAEDSQLQSIGNYAFGNCSALTSVSIPANVVSIGGSAFSDCWELNTVRIAEGQLSSIGEGAFYHDSVTSVYYDGDLVGWLSISGLGNLPHSAFYLTNVGAEITIPENITSIEALAFCGCSGLTSVTIPASVTSIGRSAFRECINLTTVNFAIDSQLQSIGSYAFEDCSALTEIEIPSTVLSIGAEAFEGCSSLRSIVIPAGVNSIERYTFRDCSELTSVTFAEDSQLNNIGYGAFDDCISLTSITIPASVTNIEDHAFCNCELLSTVIFPENNLLNDVGNCIFCDCWYQFEVNYQRTQAEWNEIEKSEDWDYGLYSYIIHCTDGDIANS